MNKTIKIESDDKHFIEIEVIGDIVKSHSLGERDLYRLDPFPHFAESLEVGLNLPFGTVNKNNWQRFLIMYFRKTNIDINQKPKEHEKIIDSIRKKYKEEGTTYINNLDWKAN